MNQMDLIQYSILLFARFRPDPSTRHLVLKVVLPPGTIALWQKSLEVTDELLASVDRILRSTHRQIHRDVTSEEAEADEERPNSPSHHQQPRKRASHRGRQRASKDIKGNNNFNNYYFKSQVPRYHSYERYHSALPCMGHLLWKSLLSLCCIRRSAGPSLPFIRTITQRTSLHRSLTLEVTYAGLLSLCCPSLPFIRTRTLSCTAPQHTCRSLLLDDSSSLNIRICTTPLNSAQVTFSSFVKARLHCKLISLQCRSCIFVQAYQEKHVLSRRIHLQLTMQLSVQLNLLDRQPCSQSFSCSYRYIHICMYISSYIVHL